MTHRFIEIIRNLPYVCDTGCARRFPRPPIRNRCPDCNHRIWDQSNLYPPPPDMTPPTRLPTPTHQTGIPALDAIGAELVLTFAPPPVPTKPALARTRATVRSSGLPVAIGSDVGLAPAPFTVLAPGEVRTMPGGRLLQALLSREGLELDSGAWVNYPPWESKEGLDDVLEATGSTAVLVVGIEAWKMYHPGIPLKYVHGWGVVHHGRHGDVVLWPVYHPDSLIQVRDREQRDAYELDIRLFAELVRDGEGEVGDWLSNVCCRCGTEQRFYDTDGLAYCEEHYDAHNRQGRSGVRITGARKKAIKKGKNIDPNQPTLA